MKKFTRKFMAIMACAVVGCGAMVNNVPIISKYSSNLTANATIFDGSTMNTTTSKTLDKRVVQLEAHYSNETAYFTGFIIGKKTIATCAHGLYRNGSYPKTVDVYIGRCGDAYSSSFTVTYSSKSNNILVHPNYIRNGTTTSDLGVIQTTTDLSSYGSFSLNTNSNTSIKNNVTVYGYPHESNYTSYYNVQCFSSGSTDPYTTDDILKYYSSTLSGMSGGPVLYDGKVVAVNCTGGNTYNSGPRNMAWLNDNIS